ncbi:OpgC domain-containing protein [Alkalilimnicola ehrlichii]|uniref:OpgC domain-containing protein n=1 Tax=Alkalilimnicola ehrlichii TaxID=351052 RepID=UPI001C6DF35A|nr:OpgC domain-containing protein [Alkalilimnicola ehrlichii]
MPHVGTADWPRRRLKLLLTGVIILFWYKLLTVVEMSHLFEPEDIVNALLYQSFPSYVEILGFYAIALLWVPFFLPLWKRMALPLRIASPVVMVGLWYYLYHHFHFWNNEPLQALLVEHEDHYTWGQLARGPLILVGLLLGELIARYYRKPLARRVLAGSIAAASAVLIVIFLGLAGTDLPQELMAIARNQGKHPPELMFMLFSVGGALFVLALAVLGAEKLATALKPITVIGSDALKAFYFHIIVIFVGFRYLLDYFHSVSYAYAMTLTLLLLLATALWIQLTAWIRAKT